VPERLERSDGHSNRVAGDVLFLVGIVGLGACFLVGLFGVGISNANFFAYRTESTPVNYPSSVPGLWVLAALMLAAALLLLALVVGEFVRRRRFIRRLFMVVWAAVAVGFNWWALSGGPSV
jgi:hypothetical protein